MKIHGKSPLRMNIYNIDETWWMKAFIDKPVSEMWFSRTTDFIIRTIMMKPRLTDGVAYNLWADANSPSNKGVYARRIGHQKDEPCQYR